MFRPVSANTNPQRKQGREARSNDPCQCCGLMIGALLSVALAGPSALAQLPVARLTSVFPLGGRQGTQVIVTVGGADLDDASGLRFSHPGITARPNVAEAKQSDAQPQAVPNQFIVQI